MRRFDFSKAIRLSASIVLIAAMALCIFSCGNTGNKAETGVNEADITITVTVVDDKGESKDFELKTKAQNLGDALLEEKLVEGEDSEFGLYIKVVDGLRADYELDGAYWSLTKGGDYVMTGADTTPIADGDRFELTYTKG